MTGASDGTAGRPQQRHPSRRSWGAPLKLVVAATLLAFLGREGFLSLEKTREAFERPVPLAAACALVFVFTLIGGARWHLLLRAQGLSIPLGRSIELQLLGIFFGTALPGTVTGDVVKAYYVGREAPERRARTLGTIVLDRLVGLTALMLVSSVALSLSGSLLEHGPALLALRTVVYGMTTATGLLFLSVCFAPARLDVAHRFLLLAQNKLPRLRPVLDVYEGIRECRRHRLAVIVVMAVSVGIHLGMGSIFLLLAQAMGEGEKISLAGIYAVVPTAMLVTAVPVAPGGIGTGHAAFHVLFRVLGSERGADVFTLFALLGLVPSAVGGILYVRFREMVHAAAGSAPSS